MNNEYIDGIQALRECGNALRRIAHKAGDIETRTDIMLIAGILTGLILRFERFQPKG